MPPRFAVAVDHHFAGHGQPRFPGKERAQPVRQPFGKHRQDAPRQVDAGAAQQRLPVETAARLHVPGDVGDRHPDAAGVPLPLGRHRIVEVPGVLPVDGDVDARAQVAASSPGQGFFRVDLGESFRFFQHLLREGAGKVETVDSLPEVRPRRGGPGRSLPAGGGLLLCLAPGPGGFASLPAARQLLLPLAPVHGRSAAAPASRHRAPRGFAASSFSRSCQTLHSILLINGVPVPNISGCPLDGGCPVSYRTGSHKNRRPGFTRSCACCH